MRTDGTPLETLAALDRRWVPRAADGLDRALDKALGRVSDHVPGRMALSATERRILGILALVLFASTLALLLIRP